MSSPGVTTATNYKFLVKCFKESKKLPPEHPDRLLGCGLEGASRTGKDWDKCVFVCQYIGTFTGKKINFFRDTFANLKKTTYRTLKQVWGLFGYPTNLFNKTASEIHFRGNIITFCGVNDDPMRAMGLESDLALMGEAMSLVKEHCDQIEQRTNEFYIYDYNPTAPPGHWLFKKESKTYRINRTTVFHNRYAPVNAAKKIISYAHPDKPEYHLIENFFRMYGHKRNKTPFQKYLEWVAPNEKAWIQHISKNIELGTADAYLWNVYGLGVRAIGEDVIFPKWRTYKDLPDENLADWILYGGDFGYSGDPAALVKVWKFGNDLYFKLLLYQTGLLNSDIAEVMIQHGWNDHISVWDSADGMKSVNELRRGIIVDGKHIGINADGATKGPGSIGYGIQYMKKFNLHIHEDDKPMIEEFESYKWARDRAGSYKMNTLKQRVPAVNGKDNKDHAIDAARYAVNYYNESIAQDINEAA